MKRIGLAALLVLSVSTGARAYSGLDLYRDCTGDAGGQLSCSAFAAGFMQALALVKTISPAGTLPAVCMPAGLPSERFVAWAQTHPAELAREPGEAFAASVFDPDSCRQKSGLNILR